MTRTASRGRAVRAPAANGSWSFDTTILADLQRSGLIQEGHFRYRSGRFSKLRLDRDHLLSDPQAASRMGYMLAKRFFTINVETVVTPSIWGAGLAQWVGYFLDPSANVVNATPKDGEPTLAPTLTPLIAGRRILVIDNLILTGETLSHFITSIEALDGEVIGVGTLWNAGPEDMSGHRVFGLLNSSYPVYDADENPLEGEPVDVGY